jgi:signal transduction histidine kinase
VPADQTRIFEPFQRGSAIPGAARATGLGLLIARQLMVAQHPTLVYEPCNARGRRFAITLRRAFAEGVRVGMQTLMVVSVTTQRESRRPIGRQVSRVGIPLARTETVRCADFAPRSR